MKNPHVIPGGTVCVTVSRGSRERFLNLCANRQIALRQVRSYPDCMTFRMAAEDFLRLKQPARKCRVHVKITRKYGLPFFLKRCRKRKWFVLGLLCGLFLLFSLSLFIWKIEISGNRTLTRNALMSWLQEQNIGYGTKRSDLDCKQIAADLRNAFPLITWVSVEQVGTLLRIELKENPDASGSDTGTEAESNSGEEREGVRSGEGLPAEDTSGERQEVKKGTSGDQEKKEEISGSEMSAEEDGSSGTQEDPEETGTDLLAPHDGTVVSIFTRAGTPQVQAGDTVTAGQVLVSGALAITNDSDEVTAVRYCASDADIELEFTDSYQETLPLQETRYTYTGKSRKGWYLKLRDQWFSTMQECSFYETEECLKQEIQLCLFADFYLPVSFGEIQVREQQAVQHLYSEEEIRSLFETHLEKFIQENQEKGVQIFEKNVRIEKDVSCYLGSCTYRAVGTVMTEAPTGDTLINQEGTS